jgi:hypothetical protein
VPKTVCMTVRDDEFDDDIARDARSATTRAMTVLPTFANERHRALAAEIEVRRMFDLCSVND